MSSHKNLLLFLGRLALDLLRSLAPVLDWTPAPRGDLIHMRATLHVAQSSRLHGNVQFGGTREAKASFIHQIDSNFAR